MTSFEKVYCQTEKIFDSLELNMYTWDYFLDMLDHYGWTRQNYMNELEQMVSAEWIRIHGVSVECLS